MEKIGQKEANSHSFRLIAIPMIGIIGNWAAIVMILLGWSGRLFGWPASGGIWTLSGLMAAIIFGVFAFGGFLFQAGREKLPTLGLFFPRMRYSRLLSRALIELLFLFTIGCGILWAIADNGDGMVADEVPVFATQTAYILTSHNSLTVVSPFRYRLVGTSGISFRALLLVFACVLSIHCLSFGELAWGENAAFQQANL